MLVWMPLLAAALAEEPARPAVDPVVARIEARYADISALKMGFTQTVASPLYGEMVQSGTVVFARPGKMRWRFTEEKKHYIGDGAVMWVYLEADKQAFKYSGWDPSSSAESLLSSLDSLDELFSVTVERTGEQGHELSLRPKGDAAYEKVQLALDGALVVQSVTVHDGAGTTTRLQFTGVELGPELPADTFDFSPPTGVEVIEAAFPQ